jgi:carboxyl-terminal processing protease
MLKKMKQTAEEEGYFEDAKAQYEDLMKKVVPSKERDLEKFKEEIKTILENEIISRYYYQKGRTIDSFRNDDYLKKAIEILKNTQEYNTILKK